MSDIQDAHVTNNHAQVTNTCGAGVGGNDTLTNQDEKFILDAKICSAPVVHSELTDGL